MMCCLIQATVNVKALEKQLQQKKDSDHIMAGILEEVRCHSLYTGEPCIIKSENLFVQVVSVQCS